MVEHQGCYESRRDYRLLTVTSRSRRFWAVSSTCTGTTTTAGLVLSVRGKLGLESVGEVRQVTPEATGAVRQVTPEATGALRL